MQVGLGQMGMSADEFWDITPREFFNKQIGYVEIQKAREKQEWARTIQLINIQLPAKDRISIDKMFNERPEPKKMSLEDRKKVAERVKKLKPNGTSEFKFPVQK